jgi:hypothetical protein
MPPLSQVKGPGWTRSQRSFSFGVMPLFLFFGLTMSL